jgi:hypothetical protein
MKNLLIGLLTFSTFASAFAGSITNRATNEYIRFDFDAKERTVNVESTSRTLRNKQINIAKVKGRKKSHIDLLGTTQTICNEVGADLEYCLLIPFFNIPGVAGLAVDILLMPIKAPMKVMQNAAYKRDVKLLLNSITTDEDIEVSNARFLRISKLL